MRILSIGNFGTGWDGSICDEQHIASVLEKLGHEVIRSQREDSYSSIQPGEVDFILIAQWDGYIEGFLPILKNAYRCPIVYWAFDYQADGQEWHERLVKGADLYLSKRIADSKYPNWQWLAQDFSPEFLYYDIDKWKHRHVEQDIDVLFTGSYLPWAEERNKILKAVDERFKLVIHSVNTWPGFKDVRPAILDEGLPELYSRAKVILSIDHTLEAGYWSDRNAQIMCCGRVPLFRYVPLSESTFKDWVQYFYDKDDCLAQIEKALTDDFSWLTGYAHPTYSYAQRYLKVYSRVQELLTIVQGIL